MEPRHLKDEMQLVGRIVANDQELTDKNKAYNLIETNNSVECNLAEADIFTWEASKVQIFGTAYSGESAPQGSFRWDACANAPITLMPWST